MKQSSSAPHSYSRSWELSLKSKAIASSWRLWCTSHHRNHNCHETVECRQSSWGIDEVLFWWFFWFHFGLRLDTVRSYYCRTPVTSHKRAAIFAQFLRVSHVHGVVIWTRQGDGKLPEVDPFLTRLVPIPTCQNQTISQEKISNFTCTFKRVCQGGLGSAWFHFSLAAQEADTGTECSSASAFGDLAALAIGQTNIDKSDTSLSTVMKIHQCYYLVCGIVEYIMYCIPHTSSYTYIILYIIYITIVSIYNSI